MPAVAMASREGIPVTFEAAKGDVRRRLNPNTGEPVESRAGAATGYAKGTVGADGDHLDFYFGEHLTLPDGQPNRTAFVLDENDRETGKFRQHKVFAGFRDEREAIAAYLATEGKTEDEIGGIARGSVDELKAWMGNPANLKKPVREHFKTSEQPIERKPEQAATPPEAAGPVGGARAAPEAPAAEESQAAEKARTSADGRIEPEHYDAVETMLKAASVDPAHIPPVVIATAAEIMRDEGRDAPDAYQIAEVRQAIEHEGLKPEQVEQFYEPDNAKAVLEPEQPSERGVRPEAPSPGAGGPAAEAKGAGLHAAAMVAKKFSKPPHAAKPPKLASPGQPWAASPTPQAKPPVPAPVKGLGGAPPAGSSPPAFPKPPKATKAKGGLPGLPGLPGV